jgi:3-oxoacyl-[acyl-carrier-protein] synthase-1
MVAHVVQVAARTPVGLTAPTSAAAVRAGISRVSVHPYMADVYGEPIKFACDPRLAADVHGVDRLERLLSSCLEQLAEALRAWTGAGRAVVLLLALPELRPGFAAEDGRELVRRIAARCAAAGQVWHVRQAGTGHAGGVEALHDAERLIQADRDTVCVVAGVESYFDGYTLEWLEERRKLLTLDARGGFAPGEGAAALLVTSDATRRQLKLPSLARVRSTALERERRDEYSAEGTFGEALTSVVQQAVGPLALPSERVDDLYCDINDERTRTTELAFTLLRTGRVFRETIQYVTPVGSVGDLGAASALFNCVLATQAWARGYAAGPHALVAGSSWGGMRGALLLQEGS